MSSTGERSENDRLQAFAYCIYVATGVAAIALLLPPLVAATFEVSRSYNEGWNAYHATRAYAAAPLYPANDALISNNYPPLSFFIVGAFAKLVGDAIMAGRILALLGLGMTTINIGLAIFLLSGNRLAALFGSSVFLGLMAGAYGSYVAMNDPQWLGHGIMTTGLLLFLRYRAVPAIVTLAAVIMVSAGLIKHNLLPVPVAVTVWIFLYGRSIRGIWITAALLSAAAGIAWITLQFGSDALSSILFAPRVYSPWRALVLSIRNLLPLMPFLALIAIYFATKKASQELGLILIYALVSVLWAAFTIGGQGVWINAFFDVYIAACILAAVAIAGLSGRPPAETRVTSLSQLLGLVAIASPVFFLLAHKGQLPALTALKAQEQTEKSLVQLIRSKPDPVICELLALCYWAGKPFSVDLFNVGQKLRTGAVPEATIINQFKRNEYALIEMRPKSTKLPPPVLDALRDSYTQSPKIYTRSEFPIRRETAVFLPKKSAR